MRRCLIVVPLTGLASLVLTPSAFGGLVMSKPVTIRARIRVTYTQTSPTACGTQAFAVFKTVPPKPPKVGKHTRIAGLDKPPVQVNGTATRTVPGGGGPSTIPVAGNAEQWADKPFEQLTGTKLKKNTHTLELFGGGDAGSCAQTPERKVKWTITKLKAVWTWKTKARH